MIVHIRGKCSCLSFYICYCVELCTQGVSRTIAKMSLVRAARQSGRKLTVFVSAATENSMSSLSAVSHRTITHSYINRPRRDRMFNLHVKNSSGAAERSRSVTSYYYNSALDAAATKVCLCAAAIKVCHL